MTGCRSSRLIWRTNGWRRIEANARKRKRVIPDAPLWQALDSLLTTHPGIRIDWCQGHHDIPGNALADSLARAAASGTKDGA